jgi:BASS family bile acid:Na+ symporter
MLMDLLSKAATVAMLSFVVSSMLAMGAGLTISKIFEPLRNTRLVVLALMANFVLMPLGAFSLAKVLWLDEPCLSGFYPHPQHVGCCQAPE